MSHITWACHVERMVLTVWQLQVSRIRNATHAPYLNILIVGVMLLHQSRDCVQTLTREGRVWGVMQEGIMSICREAAQSHSICVFACSSFV